MDEKSVRTIIFCFLVLVVLFLSLAVRCFYVQYVQNEHYTEVCTKQQRGRLIKKPRRGAIFDRNVRVLVASKRIRTIFAEPRAIKDIVNTSVKLAPIVKMRATTIIKLIRESKNPGFVRIKVDATATQCDAARQIFGIGVETDWRRSYPVGRVATHVVGFTSIDNRGLSGIEFQYDDKLRGSAGQNIFRADVFRRPIQLSHESSVVNDGVGIILTLDSAIQQFARSALIEQYESYEAEAAVAIVASAKTGAILAMVSLPDYEPDQISSADPNTFRNRAITDQFEPGSMIKPIVVAIAVDSGVIKKDERIFCENGDYYGKGFGRVNEYRNNKFGNLKVREILIKSSNIGMAKIGQKMGPEKLYNGLKLFGFARTTGVELPGEVEGLLRPTNKWTGYSVTRIPYGYELNVTAMQMLRAFCVLASGGRAVQPYIVKAVVDSEGEVIEQRHSSPDVGYIVKPEVAKWMVNDCLVGVVNERHNQGTGWRAKLDKWQVFGKTGTSNIAKVGERGYEDNSNIASFIAGAPAEDPAVVVLVSIRRPNGRLGKGDSGGAVASPVAGRILEKTLKYLRVPERTI
jgi:cell division protein FtsI (penicillin-binding protein 3)